MSHARWVAVAVFLPTVLLVGWIGQLEWKRAHREPLRVAITGYDPRDLLRGHYLRFRFDLAVDLRGLCACLEADPAAPLKPHVEIMQCGVPNPSCANPVSVPTDGFQYFVDERKAPELEKLLRQPANSASVAVHFDGDGKVSFSDLTVTERK